MIDVERFLSDHRIPYATSGSNVSRGWIGLNCCYCSDNSGHLGIHLNTGAVSCWKCGKHRLLPTLARLSGMPESDTLVLMKRYETGIQRHHVDERKASAQVVTLPAFNWTGRATDYLLDRHIQPFHIKEYGLQYGGNVGEWAFRIIIPVVSGGQVVSATGRTICKTVEPRYYNLPIERSVVDIKHTFLGMDKCLKRDHVVLVEGPFDAIKGGPGVISGFGSSLKRQQLLMLTRFKKVTLLFDSDATGRRKARILAEQLQRLGIDTETVFLDDGGKDLGDLTHSEVCNVRAELGLEEWHREATG